MKVCPSWKTRHNTRVGIMKFLPVLKRFKMFPLVWCMISEPSLSSCYQWNILQIQPFCFLKRQENKNLFLFTSGKLHSGFPNLLKPEQLCCTAQKNKWSIEQKPTCRKTRFFYQFVQKRWKQEILNLNLLRINSLQFWAQRKHLVPKLEEGARRQRRKALNCPQNKLILRPWNRPIKARLEKCSCIGKLSFSLAVV